MHVFEPVILLTTAGIDKMFGSRKSSPVIISDVSPDQFLRFYMYLAVYDLLLREDLVMVLGPLLYHPITDDLGAISHFFSSPVAKRNSLKFSRWNATLHSFLHVGPQGVPYSSMPRN